TEKLRRVIANGQRKELPCWIELQVKTLDSSFYAPVTLTDGRTLSLNLDSSSTSAEVCQAVADKIDLKDTYGFSLYIGFNDKIWSLGSCGKHVLDVVSQCEQEMRRQGQEEKKAPWRLFIRKELFKPWHDCSVDPVSTHLIYRQIITGIKLGEYTSEKEDDYVQLAARHYYIQFGSAYNKESVQRVVEECIATPLIESKSMTKWMQLISSEVLQVKRHAVRGKRKLVDSIQQKWPHYFSRFYEVTMTAGPPLSKSRFVVAVNWSGILFMDEREKRLLELSYLEIKDFVLKAREAAEMAALIETNLEGLRQRSVYALVQQDANDPRFLICKQGDLLLVEKDGPYSPEENLITATNQRTSSTGSIYKDTVQYLPTLTRPTEEVLVELLSRLKTVGFNNVKFKKYLKHMVPLFPPCHRAPGNVGRQGAFKGVGKEKLWACSKEPLKQPLLKSLVRNSDLSYLACNLLPILKYMGDYPIKNIRSPVELTDQIFGPATQHKALQDEIYCQIMRQMTSNNNRLSMERGWQLMWLCSGLFPPSSNLMRHTRHFLESRPRDPLAAVCLQKLKEPRMFPPHVVEVDAIQQNSTQIFHKVHFPNDTDDIFEVTSTTTIKDLCCSIASQLKLSFADGYGLYLKTPNKVMSLDEQKYFFDSLRQTSDFPKKAKRVKEGNANMPYLVIFKRKLWFNMTPGKDQVADLIFHFPQELPKYLRGYHNCTKEDLIILGGLLFRVKVDSDRSQFVMIPRMLRELVPTDQIKIMSSEEWKKHIISSYNKQSGITVQEAKTAFLKAISSWPTFGCTFFEVKQTYESSYPNRVLIAISKNGVSLIDPATKVLLVMHLFKNIMEYHSHGSFFQMTIRTPLRGNSFVCETSQVRNLLLQVNVFKSKYFLQRKPLHIVA
uniref:Myosin VIIBb n=1 Tax=Monopterus albus TaxID=43700 RepID=A0A3Q3J003_MONAL